LLLAFVCFGVKYKKQIYKKAKPDKQSTINEFQLTPPFVARSIDFFFLSLDIKVNESSNMSTWKNLQSHALFSIQLCLLSETNFSNYVRKYLMWSVSVVLRECNFYKSLARLCWNTSYAALGLSLFSETVHTCISIHATLSQIKLSYKNIKYGVR